jgi:hypothetical protein
MNLRKGGGLDRYNGGGSGKFHTVSGAMGGSFLEAAAAAAVDSSDGCIIEEGDEEEVVALTADGSSSSASSSSSWLMRMSSLSTSTTTIPSSTSLHQDIINVQSDFENLGHDQQRRRLRKHKSLSVLRKGGDVQQEVILEQQEFTISSSSLSDATTVKTMTEVSNNLSKDDSMLEKTTSHSFWGRFFNGKK